MPAPKELCQHPEAFCLMLYRDAAGREERIWNSRDGVTPFIIRSRSGDEMQHLEWQRDQYLPGHLPGVGDRIFADMTPDLAAERATAFVERWWDDPHHPLHAHPMFAHGDQAAAVAYFASEYLGDGHRPVLLEVTRELQRELRAALIARSKAYAAPRS